MMDGGWWMVDGGLAAGPPLLRSGKGRERDSVSFITDLSFFGEKRSRETWTNTVQVSKMLNFSGAYFGGGFCH